ncbi:MAG: hypothetical protein JO053_06265 [Acidobacteria bacterium]|nr:hypothetical protein [Acidobacteriota bacterium]
MKLLSVCLLLSLLSAAAFASDTDYSSRGGEFAILKGIRLNVGHLAFKEKRHVEAAGKPLEASVFGCRAVVTIQTRESVVSQGSEWEDLGIEYELIVSPDRKNEIHDLLIDDIYRYWTHPEDQVPWGYERGVYWKDQSYLIYDRIAVPRLVWFDGRVVQLKFIRFLDDKKSGYGAEQGFWEKKIRFYDGKTRLKIEYLNGIGDQFMKMYGQGFFRPHD